GQARSTQGDELRLGRNWLHDGHANRVERGPVSSLEHRVGVRGLLGNWLKHVPVLDDPSLVVEAEDVDARPIPVAGPLLIAVGDDVVALGDHAFELVLLAWVLASHSLEVL